MKEKQKEEIRDFYSKKPFSYNKMEVDSIVENHVVLNKANKLETRRDLVLGLLFWPIFVGIWLTTAFVWSPLIGLAIGWLPAFIGAGLVYLIFRPENEN